MQIIPRNSKVAILIVINLVFQISEVSSQKKKESEYKDLQINRKKSAVGIALSAAALPKATITRAEGNYELMSRIQSSYDMGILYVQKISPSIRIISGLHFVVGKWNYFAYIPAADFPPNMNITNELYLEHKYLWNKFRVPLKIETTLFKKNRKSVLNISAGADISFFPFEVNFEGHRHVVRGSNNQSITVMEEEILRTNNKKPWANYLVGVSKNFTKRQNLSVGIEANFSSAYFLDGTYVITLPGKPQTSGRYRVNGSGYALKAQYIIAHLR